MSCKHLRFEDKKIDTLGGESMQYSTTKCALKERSAEWQHGIYDTLFQLDIEGSFMGYNCPFADKGKDVGECPFLNEK